jgi:hypothetical protein
MIVPHRKHTCASAPCDGDSFTFYILDYVRTSQETHYGPPRPVTGIALFVYILDYVRTSQETHVCDSAPCYEDSFTFLYIRLCSYPQETRMGHHGL